MASFSDLSYHQQRTQEEEEEEEDSVEIDQEEIFMARGKIEIKKIEKRTNRQVTFSKRRNGLFKKAHELAVLCDAKVSVIVLSGNNKPYEYHTPSSSTKEIVDLYQRTKDVDVWSSCYEEMEENLRKLKEVNAKLRLEIRRRFGQDLENMTYRELSSLEQGMDESIKIIRERKNKAISNKTETWSRKLRNQKNIYRNFHGFEPGDEDLKYGLLNNMNPKDYEPVIEYYDGGSRLLAIRRLQPDPSNLDHGNGASDITTYPVA